MSGALAGAHPQVEVVIVTGLSGAGRGTAARVLEDLGWYVADNLPPELFGRMVELGASATPPIRRLALVMDVRSRFFTGDLSAVTEQLRTLGVGTRVLFLEASDDVLIRRFGFARRRHPLQSESKDGTLSAGIAAERVRLSAVKTAADLVIDTTELSIHQLHRKLEEAYGVARPARCNSPCSPSASSMGFPSTLTSCWMCVFYLIHIGYRNCGNIPVRRRWSASTYCRAPARMITCVPVTTWSI